MTGGWRPAPSPWPAFPVLPWDALLWGSPTVVALLLVQEVPPPVSESSILPPLLHPAPQPFLNLWTNNQNKKHYPRITSRQELHSFSSYSECSMLPIFTFESLYDAINIRNKKSLLCFHTLPSYTILPKWFHFYILYHLFYTNHNKELYITQLYH